LQLLANVAVAMGGRAAEEVIFGPTMITTGTPFYQLFLNYLSILIYIYIYIIFFRCRERLQTSRAVGQRDGGADGNERQGGSHLPRREGPRAGVVRDQAEDRKRSGVPPPGFPSLLFSSLLFFCAFSLTHALVLQNQYNFAKAILIEHQDELHRLAAALLEHETLNKEEIMAVIKGKKLGPLFYQ
jgi:hypothetical protein